LATLFICGNGTAFVCLFLERGKYKIVLHFLGWFILEMPSVYILSALLIP